MIESPTMKCRCIFLIKKNDFSIATLLWEDNRHLVPYLRPIMKPFFREKSFQNNGETTGGGRILFSFFFFNKKSTSSRNHNNVNNNHNINDNNNLNLNINTLPKTNSSHLKMDGWKTILSFWGPRPIFPGANLLLASGSRVISTISMVVSGSPKRWDRWHSPSPNWQEKCHLYSLPSFGVKNATDPKYHLLGEPETTPNP